MGTIRTIIEWHDAGITFTDISKVLIKQRGVLEEAQQEVTGGFTLEFWDPQRCKRAYIEMVRIMRSDGSCLPEVHQEMSQ